MQRQIIFILFNGQTIVRERTFFYERSGSCPICLRNLFHVKKWCFEPHRFLSKKGSNRQTAVKKYTVSSLIHRSAVQTKLFQN